MTQNLKPEDKEKHKSNNEKLAKPESNLVYYLMNMEKNNLKVTDNEVSNEIQKQIKVCRAKKNGLEYYQKNPSASQSLKGSYEENHRTH